ncbi:substrate-binding periplasmic protein [Roseibium denhamense]|uniref:Amino acid ABC transporter substrate-binding protein, PAAT family n=1 Tax=Roseibium denhamense TaxID=76305 RepID=A0ABY1P5R2_9HYPH|nr:transporter substrate-binding domain-containing protein [Roseibium denhamense]SMP27122.1 amino acid ABC transporter substrate-binding protein, PAAT family [Roseibium denhamense]
MDQCKALSKTDPLPYGPIRIKKTVWRLFLGIALMLVVLTSTARFPASAENCPNPLRIHVPQDYEPFSYKTSEGQIVGIDFEFVQAVLHRAGCQIEFYEMPFQRAVVELSAGRLDMTMFSSITDERRAFAHFSVPYRNETAGLVIRSADTGKFDISSLEDILSLNLLLAHDIGTYRGDPFETFLQKPEAQKHIVQVSGSEQSLQMLLKGRITAIVETPAAVFSLARSLNVEDQIEEHPFLLWSEPVHLMFSNKSVPKTFVDQVDAIISKRVTTDDYQAHFGSMSLQTGDGNTSTN